MKTYRHLLVVLGIGLSLALAGAAGAEPGKLVVDVATPGVKISPMLWGIFFEDINCSADGGIYAELVRNRSFEDPTSPIIGPWRPAAGQGGAGDRHRTAGQPQTHIR